MLERRPGTHLGYFLVDEDEEQEKATVAETHELIGDVELLTETQKDSFWMLKESSSMP